MRCNGGGIKGKFYILIIGALLGAPLLPYHISYSGESSWVIEDRVLNVATRLFKAMEERHYKKVWELLTEKSKKEIVELVYKHIKNQGYTKESIEKDFEEGGPIAKAFWDGYLKSFDPKKVLDESRWEKVSFDGDKAKITIKYKKAKLPFYLKMKKENGTWKVGLIETFGV